ncbi:hypothetical protein V6K52_14110 [Knoellia sp. S7-12]|uniref:hypothetical protein n=1 Tax=Knoellia sp. S7-12 TaxID=3126698 RepID=UPI003366F75D
MTQLNPDGPVIAASSLGLVLFGGIWMLFAVPFVRGLIVGLRSDSWWRPFEQDARGRYGVLANSRFFASFRSPEPDIRTQAGLITRWVFWTIVVAGLGFYPVTLVVGLVKALTTP